MNLEKQKEAPLFEALKKYRISRVVAFDVPGHKQGKGNKELTEFLGKDCLNVDVNSMKPLDNLAHPTSVIKEAEDLMADAFGVDKAFFMVGGTTSSVQAMLMASLKEGDKVILPRNVHRSAINALILIGAEPIYINPGVDEKLGIALGMSIEDIIFAMDNNKNVKAIFVNNPTYYGICSDLKSIIAEAHRRNILVLADEAHGTHFYFGENLPQGAMTLGADMACVSMHKTGGSLTQSSALLVNSERVNANYVRTVINITQTTSASYLLLSSLDIARKNLALNGKETFEKVLELSEYARNEINKIDGYYAYSEELINNKNVFAFDKTKLCVSTKDMGLAGIEVYDELRDSFGIQIELGDISNILAIISVGDNAFNIERLVASLAEIKRRHQKDKKSIFIYEYIEPEVVTTPKYAFYAETKTVNIFEAKGCVSAEFIMAYPPGIPVVAPGERITADVINYVKFAKEKGSLLLGTQDMDVEKIKVLEEF